MENKISQRLTQFYYSNKLPWIIIGIGIFLRLIRYFHNPSFYFDESVYALDIIKRPLLDLINPSPDFEQGNFVGFFFLAKFAIQIFGNSEYAFRLFPLLFSIASLFLFYRLAKYCLITGVVPIALGLFAISEHVVYYSALNKSYSSEIFFALLIFNFAFYIQSRGVNMVNSTIFAFLGIVSMVFSAPSIFILAGVGTTLTLSCFIRKDWADFRKFFIISVFWALSFAVYYILYIHNMVSNISSGMEQMLKWENGYMPVPPMSLADVRWFIDLFFEIFRDPAGLFLSGIAGCLFILGLMSMYSEKKEVLFLLITPMLFTLVATGMHKYLFKNRGILFLVPVIIYIIAHGFGYLRDKTRSAPAISVIVIVFLFFHPLTSAAYHAVKPLSSGEIKPVLSYIKEKWQPGDIVYVHFYSQYQFEYYSKYHPEAYTFDNDEYVIGIAARGWYNRWKKQEVSKYYSSDTAIIQTDTDVFREYAKDINKLKGHKRVWVLFTESITRRGMKEEQFFVYQLDVIGQQMDSFGKSGVSMVYLYDLSK